MPDIVVLGAGLVGSVMASDLAADADINVTLADRSTDALQRAQQRTAAEFRCVEADLADPASLARTIESADVVVGALASAIGFQTLRTVIETGKPYCDISFMPEDAWDLDDLAKEHSVCAVVDCGVAPGMSNVLSGYGRSLLDTTQSIEIYVGGLPVERSWPFEYKAGFSPHDVLEEYTRPSRIVEHGRVVIREALSEPERMDFPGVGTLEAFNTDGLRSLAHTFDVPFMKEKTLRYPGHIELMRVFRETGLFSQDPITVNGASVKPLDVTSALMFPKWTYEELEADLTVMRVIVKGTKDTRPQTHTWDLLDYLDPESGFTSMSRTTAFPCTIMARLLARGAYAQPGVITPELLGTHHDVVGALLEGLATRDVMFEHTVT